MNNIADITIGSFQKQELYYFFRMLIRSSDMNWCIIAFIKVPFDNYQKRFYFNNKHSSKSANIIFLTES